MERKIKKISVVDQVAEEIKQEIVNGVWQVGDKIPSEGEFAETFGVNRLSIRLALEKLNTLGLIETRVGEGSFVKRMSLAPVFNELEKFYDENSYLDVMQFRYLLESDCMRRAEKFGFEEEKAELRVKLEEYNDNLRELFKDVDNQTLLTKTAESDYAFHFQIVKMSHNRLYADLYHMIHRLVVKHICTILEPRVHKLIELGISEIYSNEGHQKMYEAIIDKDESVIEDLCSKMVGIHTIDELKSFEKAINEKGV